MTFKLIGVGEVAQNPSWRIPSHLHRNHEIIVVIEGEMTVVTKEGRTKGRKGDVLFYRAGLAHEESSDPKDPVHTIFIAFQYGMFGADIPLRTQDLKGRIRDLAIWLFEERNSAGQGAEELRDLFAQSMIAELARLNSAVESDGMVEEVRSRMLESIGRPVDVGEFAEFAGMSKFAFIRKYRRLTGRTPMDEFRQMRVAHARDLILSTGLPLKEIATASGLGDVFQMTKTFRRYLGATPGSYRRISHRR